LPLSVSISSASPGVTIYYTTNGSTPTTASTVYTGPITVVMTTTIKAIAVRAGWSQSAVASATYTHVLF
jgi:chitobiase/beta-hexosaminidase-like protein